MSETDKVFAGSIPENYDRFLVPLIFETLAQDIAHRVGALSPSSVLETAAGSGVVTRALTPRLAPDASYVVTDLNQPMLDYAGRRQPADRRIRWRKADAQALPFEDAAFDVVCCQFGVMFFPDLKRAIGRQSGSSSLEGASCSMFGIVLRRTCLRTM
jgi:ubiquinone/menaquinone biosynthesis C-methylase UbiE